MKKESVVLVGCNPICSCSSAAAILFLAILFPLMQTSWYALIQIQVWEVTLEDLWETLCWNAVMLLHVVFLWGEINYTAPEKPCQTNLNS